MSRIGKNPIEIPQEVSVEISGNKIIVKGPKGTLSFDFAPNIKVKKDEKFIYIEAVGKKKESSALWGTTRATIANMIKGVRENFEKELELVGVGYRARLDGGLLVMSLGWNHPIKMTPPEGIQIEVPEETKITIKGFDKQKVGEFAAKIREIRKPEPYKGKGIRYENEYVRRKSSKASVA